MASNVRVLLGHPARKFTGWRIHTNAMRTECNHILMTMYDPVP